MVEHKYLCVMRALSTQTQTQFANATKFIAFFLVHYAMCMRWTRYDIVYIYHRT